MAIRSILPRLIVLITLGALSVGCATQSPDNGYNAFVGTNIQQDLRRLPVPDSQRLTKDGSTIYVWDSSRDLKAAAAGFSSGETRNGTFMYYGAVPIIIRCTLTVSANANGAITSVTARPWRSYPRGCSTYLRMLSTPPASD